MAIRVTCGTCQKTLGVKDEYAGRSVKCPQCGAAIKVPATMKSSKTAETKVSLANSMRSPATNKTNSSSEEASSSSSKVLSTDSSGSPKKTTATAANDPNQLMREILAAFEGEFPRVRPTIGYRLAALFVAGVMVLLPLVYVALIGLFGYALYWHATENVSIFSAARGFRSGKGAAVMYLTPLVIGGILILFMFKPLFARPPKRQREVKLAFTDEPILHSFVQRLCQAVNAPQPTTIEVNCEVNAAAFFRGGIWSVLSNDLGLQIGLPLLSALSTRQLAGVLAHELGHFSQGAGMRLSYVIRGINGWFARVIYERDEWDEWLASWHEDDSGWVVVIGWLTSLFVWLTRRVLWVLMMIGHTVSCVLLRQMEYDADKYEARLAGSDVFETTSRRMVELSFADSMTRGMVGEHWERAGLPDNLPLCLSKVARKLPPEMALVTEKLIKEEPTSWFSSHPTNRDRIVAAHRQQARGIFHLERPAKVLLKDFSKVSEAATLLFYQRIIGKTAAKQQLTPTATFLAQVHFDTAAN